MPNVILCNLSDANSIIEEEKLYWINDILLSLGVSEDIMLMAEKQIDEFKYEMHKLGIDVELVSDGTINVYKMKWHQGINEESSGWLPPTKEHLIAQWKSPKRIKKIEGKKVYYEIHLDEWSLTNARNG